MSIAESDMLSKCFFPISMDLGGGNTSRNRVGSSLLRRRDNAFPILPSPPALNGRQTQNAARLYALTDCGSSLSDHYNERYMASGTCVYINKLTSIRELGSRTLTTKRKSHPASKSAYILWQAQVTSRDLANSPSASTKTPTSTAIHAISPHR
jgi:hypothetical protein